MKRRILLPILIALLGISASAQMTVSGEVIEVVDGKTAIIAISTGKVKAELQYIEVPENGQQLHDTVTQHLRSKILGKIVEYRAQTILLDRTIGRMLLNGVDVSQQMLRDGAAWHISAATSGQESTERSNYASTEADARNEKLGVWSIPELRPAWEFRAAKAETMVSKSPQIVSEPKMPVTQVERRGKWGDKNPALGNIGALVNGYNAETKSGYVGTSYLGVPETELDKAIGAKTAVDITYFYKEDEKNVRQGVYVVTVVSASTRWRFLSKNDLFVINDDKTTLIGKAKRTTSTKDDTFQESLSYTVKRSDIEQIANGGDVLLKVGDYQCRPLPMLQYMLFNLLQVTQ